MMLKSRRLFPPSDTSLKKTSSTKTGTPLKKDPLEQCTDMFLFASSPLRKLIEGRRSLDKNRWINSPNVYQKVEILEQGAQDPKKITKVEPNP
jgi:hypothetical protein